MHIKISEVNKHDKVSWFVLIRQKVDGHFRFGMLPGHIITYTKRHTCTAGPEKVFSQKANSFKKKMVLWFSNIH